MLATCLVLGQHRKWQRESLVDTIPIGFQFWSKCFFSIFSLQSTYPRATALQILVVTKFETAKNYFARVNFCTHRLTSLYSDVSRDVMPGSSGVVYFCGWQKQDVAWCFLLFYCQRNGFVERIPLSCCVINCTNRFTISSGVNFSRFPESEPKPTAWINHFCKRD